MDKNSQILGKNALFPPRDRVLMQKNQKIPMHGPWENLGDTAERDREAEIDLSDLSDPRKQEDFCTALKVRATDRAQ